MSIDPDLVRVWLTGWTLARGTPPPVALPDCWRVDVGWPDQKARFVFPAASNAVTRRAAAIREAHVFLKVVAPPDVLRALLPESWHLQSPRFMMTHGRLGLTGGGLAPGYRQEDDGRTARILLRDAVVASGQVVMVEGRAIFDSIKVDADHRRRGLGRALVAALTAMARDAEVVRGVLVATQDGRALYETLGWRVHAPYTSASLAISNG